MNIFQHIRLGGAVLFCAGVYLRSYQLALVGLAVQYTGVLLHLDSLERRLKEKEDESAD